MNDGIVAGILDTTANLQYQIMEASSKVSKLKVWQMYPLKCQNEGVLMPILQTFSILASRPTMIDSLIIYATPI